MLLGNLSIFGSLIAVNRVKKHKIFVLITSARNKGSYENTNPYFPVKLVKISQVSSAYDLCKQFRPRSGLT